MTELPQAANAISARQPDIWEKVPERNKNFTGREDLLLRLRQGISTVTAVVPQPRALQGWGGVGKTHLAIEYAHRYRSHYDLVWWIPSDQRVLVPSALAAMAPHLNLPPASATGIDEAAEAVKRTLESGEPYRRWLLIFDNAEDPAAIKEFIPRGPGHVLITSRNPKWEDDFETLQVDVFNRDESLAFIDKRTRTRVDEEAAARLADKLGDLPLALEQAGALMYEVGISIDEYIELFDEQASQLLNVNKAPDYPLSMTAAWRVSVSRLQDHQPEALDILRYCAFFGPEPIPRDVFRRGAEGLSPRLSRILSDPILLIRCLGLLRRFALARMEPTARTIQVHRLIQKLLRDDLPREEQEEFQHQVHLLLAGAAPRDPDTAANWPAFQELVAHVTPAGVARCTVPRVREFALNIVRYLYVAGNYQAARSLANELIDRWTAASGSAHKETLVARVHLANIVRALGEYTAAHKLEEATLNEMREVFAADSPELLWAYNGFSATLRARGDFTGAKEYDSRTYDAYRESLGDYAPATLRSMHNLAIGHASVGDYESATALFQESYIGQRDANEGVSQQSLVNTWNGLARTVRLQGDIEEACELGQDAYDYGVQELTINHPQTLLAAKDLSIARRRAGELDEALRLAEEAHTRFRRSFGDGHPNTMAAAITLSNALREVGRIEEAFALAQETVPRYPRVFNEDHPYTHACNGNLAVLHRLRGDAALACDINDKALKSLADRLGRDHDYTLTCAVNLQSDLAALGRLEDAVKLGQDSLERLRRVFKDHHYLTLACAHNLVLDLVAAGQKEAAAEIRDEMGLGHEDGLGPNHRQDTAVDGTRRIDCDFDPAPI